jgi:hypothetical protein
MSGGLFPRRPVNERGWNMELRATLDAVRLTSGSTVERPTPILCAAVVVRIRRLQLQDCAHPIGAIRGPSLVSSPLFAVRCAEAYGRDDVPPVASIRFTISTNSTSLNGLRINVT